MGRDGQDTLAKSSSPAGDGTGQGRGGAAAWDIPRRRSRCCSSCGIEEGSESLRLGKTFEIIKSFEISAHPSTTTVVTGVRAKHISLYRKQSQTVFLEQWKESSAPAVSKLGFSPSFPSCLAQPCPSLLPHLGHVLLPREVLPCSQGPSACLLPTFSSLFPLQLPQKEDPSLGAVMRLDLSISAACASPPALSST